MQSLRDNDDSVRFIALPRGKKSIFVSMWTLRESEWIHGVRTQNGRPRIRDFEVEILIRRSCNLAIIRRLRESIEGSQND